MLILPQGGPNVKKIGLVLLAGLAWMVEIPAFAGAMMTVQGTLQSFTTTHFLIQSGNQIFHIRKKAVVAETRDRMEKVGTSVRVTVPIAAIDTVRLAKAR